MHIYTYLFNFHYGSLMIPQTGMGLNMVVIFTALDASRILMKRGTLNLYRAAKRTLEKWNNGLVRLFGKGASAV